MALIRSLPEKDGAAITDTDLMIIEDGTNTCQTTIADIKEKIMTDMLDLIYPIGAIYMSLSSTDPGTMFGGLWSQIEGRFLLGAGTDPGENSYTGFGTATRNYYGFYAGNTMGEYTHTLSTEELPSHTHNFSGQTWSWGYDISDVVYQVNSDGSVPSATFGTVSNNGLYTRQDIDTWANCTTYTGSGQAFSNLPPCLIVYMWRRVA